MSDQSSSKSFIIGALVGGIVALLFAPKSGKQLRNDISRKCDDVAQKAHEGFEEVKSKAKDLAEKGKNAGKHVMEGVEDAASTAKDTVHQVKNDLKK